MNKVLNVITLIIMVSVNIMTPFSYAEFDDIVTESAAESTEQDDGGDTGDSLSEDSESEDNSEEDSEEISQTNDEEENEEGNEEDSDEEENQEGNEIENSEDEEEGSEEESDIDENSEDENTQDSSTSSQNDEDSEDEEGQVGSGEDSSLQASQNENNTQDSLSGASEGELGNGENSIELENEEENPVEGEAGSGDISAIEMVIDSIESLSGIYLSGDITELSGEVVELTGNDLELSIARETLNETLIQKSEYYNGVTVNVEAQPGNFPQGTELRINPVLGIELDEVKNQVSDKDKNISEESLVAFDISFIYILSGGDEIEVQPKNLNGVKVVFNYENNEKLSDADTNEEQEIKVFHIDDKDDNGVGEVKDVTNRVESEEEGIAVAKAESFSIYAVVTTASTSETISITHNLNGGYWLEGSNPMDSRTIEYTCVNNSCTTTTNYRTPSKTGYMFMGWFEDEEGNTRWIGENAVDGDEVYAKWQEFGDLDVYILGSDTNNKYHYTLMDRNMGAKSKNTAGYYYQWGNNFGFTSGWGKTEEGKIDTSNYSGGNPYMNSTFYLNAGDGNGNWIDPKNPNLWGGNSSNTGDRQGPCPDGYHVPTITEWDGARSKWKTYYDTSRTYSAFYKDFLIVGAGYVARGTASMAAGDEAKKVRYATSTLNGNGLDKKIVRMLGSDGVGNNEPKTDTSTIEWSANGMSVRCFKNTINASGTALDISDIHLDGGLKAIISITSGEVVSLQNPTKAGHEFVGWYTNDSYTGTSIGVGSGIEAGSSLYAKWGCGEGYIDEEDVCVPGFYITFDATTNGGTSGDMALKVLGNSTGINLLDYTAEKEGYYFVGWNTDAGAGTGLQGEQTFTQKTTLYAIFLKLYTYTFLDEEGESLGTGYYQGGVVSDMERLIPLEYYLSGKVADTSLYPELLKLGITEEGKGRRWVPELPRNKIATQDLIVTGEIDELVTVTFLDGNGSSYLSYGVVSGSKIDYITGPEGEAGYQFVDWYEDAGLNVRFDFSTKTITGNTTIYPGFTEVLCTFTTENVTAGLKITGFSGTPTEECLMHFVIPSKIGGKIVKQIGYRAFKGKSISGEIILPDTVTYIGEEAFANNEISGKLKLPNNIENIDKSAFYNNKISGQLDLPESLTKVGVGAFATNNISGRLVIPGRINNGVVGSEYRCNPIEEVIFGIGTTEITKEAFADHGTICNDSTKHTIKHVEFPSTLQIIRNQAFNGQIIEGELELPNSLTIVEDVAFGGNKISGILRIPGSVTTVTNAFNCNPIEEVVFGEGITKINGNAFNADCNNKKDGKIEKITLPSTLTSIGDRAFKFQSLTGELIIPNGVTSIGYEAFTANKNQIGGQLIIPDSVISIGYNAFENNQITGLILGSSLQTIGNNAFNRNQLTGELIIPNSVTFIGNYAFDGYNGNNRIGGQLVIPDSVTFIGQYAFRNNQITGVILGNGLGTIEAGIFQNNKVEGQLIIPDSVISIGYNAFENNQITGLILGSSLQTIRNNAFNRNQLTGELIIPNSVQTIGNYAFDGYNGNNRIEGQLVIPDSVTSIGEYAFRSNQITGLILGNGLVTINVGVFQNNQIEGQLIIPDSVTYIGVSSFQNNKITSLRLGSNVDTIRQDAFNQNKLEGELIIPDSVTFIGKQAFDGNNGGNKISGQLIIPDSVTSIGDSAFRSNQLTGLILGDYVESIGGSAFYNNQIEGELIIPDSVTSIGGSAFKNNQLTGLVLGNGLSNIGNNVFENNQIEGEFVIPDNVVTIGTSAFGNNKISGTLFIPGRINSGVVNNAFRNNYLEKVIFGEGITIIGNKAFYGDTSDSLKKQIKNIELPSTLTGIGDYAFYNQRLETLMIPEEVLSVGSWAFYGNQISGTLVLPDSLVSIADHAFDIQYYKEGNTTIYLLTSVHLGENVQTIGYRAFATNDIKSVYIPDSIDSLGNQSFDQLAKGNNVYVTGYVTTKKPELDYTGAYIKPLYQLYTYTFVNDNGDILGTGYYPEILESNTTKLIPLDYYNGIGNINDFTGVDELITSPEGYKVVWSTPLSESSVVTESLVVTGSVEKVHTVVFKNPFTGDIVEYIPNNQYVSEPEEFVVQGYTFTGWYSGDVKVEFPLQVTSDLILTGRYDTNKYTVNFYEDEEAVTPLTGGTFDYNTVLDVENPQKAGKAFGGWYYLSGSEEVFVKIPVTVDKDLDFYAKWGNPVSIVFDANGGEFSDYSTQKTIVYAEDGECGLTTKYSHTSNIDDAGERNGTYANNLSTKDVVKIPGVDKLHVSLQYSTEDWRDYLYVFQGEYEGAVSKDMSAGQLYTFNGGRSTELVNSVDFYVEGDTVTFAFYSDNTQQFYGYYAVITEAANYYTPNIEEPTKEDRQFGGWYTDQGGDNPFIMSCNNKDKTAYAKWIGYTGWNGCFEYSTLGKDDNGNYIAEITDYRDECSRNLEEEGGIPSQIERNGNIYRIVKIGDYAFKKNGDKKIAGKVVIPNSVEEIGENAFNGSNITGLVLGNNVRIIGDYAFQANYSLSGIVNFPSSLRKIGSGVFWGDSTLKGITFEEGLESIGYAAFESCPSLNGSIIIPTTVREIGAFAFMTNSSLDRLELLSEDVVLGGYGTICPNSVDTLIINGGGNLGSGDTIHVCPDFVKTLIIGDGVTEISQNMNFNGLEKIVISDSVKKIGDHKFQGLSNLKELRVGAEEIGEYAFQNAYSYSNGTGLQKLEIGSGVKKIGTGAFSNSVSYLTGLELPDSVEIIGNYAFYGNYNTGIIKELKIGTGAKTIGDYAFYKISNELTGLEIPDSVETIGNYAFGYLDNLGSVKLGSGIKNIGQYAFAGAMNLTGLELPNSIETLGDSAFCTDYKQASGSVIGLLSGANDERIAELEAQENTECFVIKNSAYQVNIALTGENMGDFAPGSETSGSKNYGKRIVIKVESRLGYKFWKWEVDGTPVMTGEFKNEYWTGDLELVVTSGMNITGFFTGDINTYAVHHRKENLDGEYSGEDMISLTGYGITDELTNAVALDFPGFTGKAFDQKIIAASGDTVIDIYYDRELYTISFNSASGSAVTGITEKYEKEIQKPEDPERAGYEFSGWYYDSGELCEFPIPMPLNGVNLTAQWTANTGTEYKVEYYLQNEDLINYDFHLTGTQQGTTNTKGTAKVITFTGYEFNATHAGNITSGTIAGDGSLVLRLFYDRKSYTVSTGTNDESMGTISYQGQPRYGKKIKFTAHRDLGYILDRWEVNGDTYYSGSALWTGDELEIELTGDLAVIGHFSAAIYKIIYHDIEEIRPDKVYTGAYKTTTEEALAPTWTKTGYTLSWSGTKPETYPAEDTVIDSVWTANKYKVEFGANEGTGEMLDQEFIYNETQNLRENSYTRTGYTFTGWKNGENVYEDEENVINLATESGAVVTLEAQWREHKYTVNYEGGEGAQGSMASKEVRYTEEFELPDNNDSFVKTGYTFSGWICEANSYATGTILSGLTAQDNGSVTFTADWKANTYTQFKVEYYLQNVEDNEYTFAETGTQEGTTDGIGQADTTKEFTGFTFSGENENNILTGNIAGDGSLVLKVYYDRNNYEVRVETNDANKGTVEGGGTYRYGKRITLIATHKQGYRFEKWMRGEEVLGTGETLEITVEEAMGVTGYFVASGNTYTVEHWQQNVDDNYTEITTDRENKEGMTDDDTEAVVRPYEGFTLSGSLSDYQTRILPDGSTVVKLYYNRNNYEVSYVFEGKVPAGQSAPLGNTYRYGETVPAAEARAESGYSFAWDNADSFTMPANNVVITGRWTADTDTKYHVQYRLQNADNDGYTQTGSDVEKIGETDTTAYANTGVEYVGFTFSGNHAENVLTGNIAGDGSLVLKVYYDMKLYSVTTGSNDETQGSVTVEEGPYTYGKRITFRAHPRDALHKFIRWEVNGETVISGGVVWTGDLEVVVTGDVVVTGHFAAYAGCEWNGGIIAHGTSVTGYQTPEVEFGGTCVSEIRTCNDGELSGSYQYTGCEVAAPSSCELPWGGYAAHEAIVTGYQVESETCPNECEGISASCYNGEWSISSFTGTYVKSGCTTNPVEIPADYVLDTCPAHGNCSSITGYTVSNNACVLGEEKYKLDSCEVHYHKTGDNKVCEIDSFEITWSYKDAAGNETGDTTTVEYGQTPTHIDPVEYQTAQTGYTFANWTPELTGATENTGYTAVYDAVAREYSVMTGTNDNEQGSITVETSAPYTYGKKITFSAHPRDALHKFIRWEVNGEEYLSGGVVWTGDLEVVVTGDVVVTGHFAAYSGCEWDGGIIAHGTSVTGYQAEEVEFGGTCVSEIRTCNDGELSGSYQYTGCEVAAPLSCELPWGGYAAHEAIVTGYQANSETCPAQCSAVSAVANCYNGEWSVAGFTGTYVESGCTTKPVEIPADYVLDTCPAHGNCSSITGYTVNENACVLGEEKYRLNSCEEHYHKSTDGKLCEADPEEDTGRRRSGGGGHHSITPRDNRHGSAEDEISDIEIEDIMETIDITEDEKSEYSDEVIDAYKWSYAESIVTVLGLTNANPEGYVNRGQLARMVVKYANIIGKETPLDTPTRCYWNDNYRDWESEETKFYAEKACALGIMGIRVDKFSPKKLVSRAEFGTVFSRLLWGDQYDIINPSDNNPYYRKHLEALKREGIMTQIDNPGRRLELMKWIWVMFRRVKSPK